MLPLIIKMKESQVLELTKKYKIKKQMVDRLYLKVSEIEKPIEQQLALNMHLSMKKQALEAQGDILDEKISTGYFKSYDAKNNVQSVMKRNHQPDFKKYAGLTGM